MFWIATTTNIHALTTGIKTVNLSKQWNVSTVSTGPDNFILKQQEPLQN